VSKEFSEEAVRNAYLGVVRSMLEKIQKRHPGQDPQKVLGGAMASLGNLLLGLGDLEPNEAFCVLGFAAAISSASVLKHKGPNEVAPYVKAMAELFAYTMLDRIPSTIDQMVKQDAIAAQRAGKVKLPS
jgi:hypothetical protein